MANKVKSIRRSARAVLKVGETPAVWKREGIDGTAFYAACWNSRSPKTGMEMGAHLPVLRGVVSRRFRSAASEKRFRLSFFLVLGLSDVRREDGSIAYGVIAIDECGCPRPKQPGDDYRAQRILGELA